MKNKFYERLYKRLKHNHRISSWRWSNQKDHQGVRVHHEFHLPGELSWWDDTGFIMGKKDVTIFWIHPRMKYKDKVEDLAHDEYEKIEPYFSNINVKDWLSDSTPNYKKVGKSRKKIVTYTMNGASRKEAGYYERRRAFEENLLNTSDYVAKPSFKVDMPGHSRFIDICAPFEIYGVDDLKAICALVKRILCGETTIEAEFPNYQYTVDNWVAEKSTNFGIIEALF